MSLISKPIVKDLKVLLDDRGHLYEILRSDDYFFSKFGQLYVSTINPGVVKAFHIHQRKTDYTVCVYGQVKFVVIDGEEDGTLNELYEYHISPMSQKLIVVPPGLWHGWMCVGNKEAVLVNITTEPYKKETNDETRVAAINNPWNYKWEVKNG